MEAIDLLVYSSYSPFSVKSIYILLISAFLFLTSTSKEVWANSSSSLNLAMDLVKLVATSFNKSLTFYKASELANSPVVMANKALTMDPSTFLEILF